MAVAAKTREATVGMATPSTPMRKPKISRAFPAALMTFITRETHMEIFEFPMTRKRAAPAL